MFDFDCVILHTPMNSRASVRLGGGEGWGVVRDSKQMRRNINVYLVSRKCISDNL